MKAVCGQTIATTHITIVETGNAYIPLADLVSSPMSQEEMPTVCFNCAMMIFSAADAKAGDGEQTVIVMFRIGLVERDRGCPAE